MLLLYDIISILSRDFARNWLEIYLFFDTTAVIVQVYVVWFMFSWFDFVPIYGATPCGQDKSQGKTKPNAP
jgi:hypothetical protein